MTKPRGKIASWIDRRTCWRHYMLAAWLLNRSGSALQPCGARSCCEGLRASLLFARGGPPAVGEALDLHAAGAGVFVDPSGEGCGDGAGKLRPCAADGEFDVTVAPDAADGLIGAEVAGP